MPRFVPSETYRQVIVLLHDLSPEELNRLKLQDIHHEQLERQGRLPQEGEPHSQVGLHAVRKVVN